ncbi:unnamed protein product [Withania somnifera]
MAEQKGHSEETINKDVAPEITDRGCGLFNFIGKEVEDKAHNNTPANVVEPKEEKHSLMEKLHRTHSNSSSSSDDEETVEGGTGEKKRKKKGLKENVSGDHDQQEIDNCPAPNEGLATHDEDKKSGFMDKIKEKLPGFHNKTDQEVAVNAPTSLDEQVHGGETKEKKGFLDKIKDKLPGHGQQEQ